MSIFTNDFDQIVSGEFKKSVVVAPSDPNGGAKLPDRQENKEKGKKKAGQYEAVFDREYRESNDQLDDWMKDTNEATGSPEKFVNDDDDKTWAEDPDNEEDGRGGEYYDALSDDNPEEGVKVRKSHEAEEEKEEKEEEKEEKEEKKENKAEKEERRKKEVRKALGRDAANFADASPFAKALVDGIFDLKDDMIAEIRSLHSRVNQLEKALRSDSRAMTKSLASGMAQLKPPAINPDVLAQLQSLSYGETQPQYQNPAMPMRKGYGAEPIVRQKYPEPWDFAKSLDVLQEGFEKGIEGIRSADVTILENDHSPQNLSPAALRYLIKEKCIPQGMF